MPGLYRVTDMLISIRERERERERVAYLKSSPHAGYRYHPVCCVMHGCENHEGNGGDESPII